MKRLALVIITVLLGTGCSTMAKQPEVVKVPVLYCPAPSNIDCSDLPLGHISSEQLKQPGEVAKMYKATVEKLQGCIAEYEKQVDFYKNAHDSYNSANNGKPGDAK